METTQLKVGGMTCGGCANSVKKVVSALPGVSAVDVDWQAGHTGAWPPRTRVSNSRPQSWQAYS